MSQRRYITELPGTELMNGTPAGDLLSNGWNHPNRFGHELVTEEIMKWFPAELESDANL